MFTKEKVYTVAGPKWKEREVQIIIIEKAVYGLKTSGNRWHAKFSETLRGLEFVPCKIDENLWMKDCGTHYEYICTHVDNFIIALMDLESIMKAIQADYHVKNPTEPKVYVGQ